MDFQKNAQLIDKNTDKRPQSIDRVKELLQRNSLNAYANNKQNASESREVKQLENSDKKLMPKTQTMFDRQNPLMRDQVLSQPMSIKNDQANNNQRDEYQSMLLSRFIKEPRLPSSSNIVNKRKSFGPIIQRTNKQNSQKLNQTAAQDAQFQSSGIPKGAQKKKGFKKPEISYRNQHEIMKKIFGNEQNYKQVKELFKPSQDQYQPFQNSTNDNARHTFRAQSTPQQEKVVLPISSPTQAYNQQYRGNAYYPEKMILAKSKEKLQEPLLQENTSLLPQAGSDQVEKALFELQDVKNNYFQEKQQYDLKIQQIQFKQQNTTTYGNGFLQPMKTSSSFFNGSQRPMTQGGLMFKNQSMINDENILKGDLDQVSKEDLKERLVVAEMVMKKLFQRNKDLEDLLQNKPEATPDGQTTKASTSSTQKDVEDSKLNFDAECPACIDLRKELLSKEEEYQQRINTLQEQILSSKDISKDDQHLQYLKLRIEELMGEAKRHFNNYAQQRNLFNNFLESRLNIEKITGGTKGQKLQSDILGMLKKNLEVQDQVLQDEVLQMKKSLLKIEALLDKKDVQIQKKQQKIKSLRDEIERRQFLETKVQKYVKGLISQNQRQISFIEELGEENLHKSLQQKINEFLRSIQSKDYDENEGESTENDQEEAVDVDDL